MPTDAGTKNRQDEGLMPEADPLSYLPSCSTPHYGLCDSGGHYRRNPNSSPYPYTYQFENCNIWDWMPDTITMTLL